jgi:two-component sensor histidine kinase
MYFQHVLFILFSTLSIGYSQKGISELVDAKNRLSKYKNTESLNVVRIHHYQLLHLSNKYKEPSYKFYAHVYLADAYSRIGVADSTILHYTKALKYASTEDSLALKAQVHHKIAIVHKSRMNLIEAASSEIIAAKYAERGNDSNFRGAILNGLGKIYDELHNPERAERYFAESIKLKSQNGERRSLMITLRYFGTFLARYGRLNEALTKFSESLALANELNDELGKAHAYFEISTCFWNLKQEKRAIEYGEKSIKLWRKFTTDDKISNIHEALGRYYLALNNLVKAEEHLHIASKGNLPKNVLKRIRHYQTLSELYIKKEDFKKAFHFIKIREAFEDSIAQTKTISEMNTLKHNYETEVKDRKIAQQELAIEREQKSVYMLWALLTLSIAVVCTIIYILRIKEKSNKELQLQKKQIEEKNIIIEQALNDKDVLLKEIHHRVKNNLQVISSLLNLQSEAVLEPAAAAAIQEGRNRIKSIALLHQLLYQSDQIVDIDFKVYVNKLITFLRSVHDSPNLAIEFNLDIEKVSLDIDTAVPIGIILNELITNAFKYAFDSRISGKIFIDMKAEEAGNFRLKVRDNGVGLPLNLDPLKTDSLGLRLVVLLTRQLQGEFKYFNANGAQFQIRFSDTETRKKTA